MSAGAAKIRLVTGESIRIERALDEVVADINAALSAGSLVSVPGSRGATVWVNPVQIVQIDAA